MAKCYLNEPDAALVRRLASQAAGLYSSSWCFAELACVFLRHVREGSLTRKQANQLQDLFREDVGSGVWLLLSVSNRVLYRVGKVLREIPETTYLRAGDAVHLVTALDSGFGEIWSNDRHMLKAAPRFGLKGRSIDPAS